MCMNIMRGQVATASWPTVASSSARAHDPTADRYQINADNEPAQAQITAERRLFADVPLTSDGDSPHLPVQIMYRCTHHAKAVHGFVWCRAYSLFASCGIERDVVVWQVRVCCMLYFCTSGPLPRALP